MIPVRSQYWHCKASDCFPGSAAIFRSCSPYRNWYLSESRISHCLPGTSPLLCSALSCRDKDIHKIQVGYPSEAVPSMSAAFRSSPDRIPAVQQVCWRSGSVRRFRYLPCASVLPPDPPWNQKYVRMQSPVFRWHTSSQPLRFYSVLPVSAGTFRWTDIPQTIHHSHFQNTIRSVSPALDSQFYCPLYKESASPAILH